MGACELCGREGSLLIAAIEGVDLRVCNACARHGTVKKLPPALRARPSRVKPAKSARVPEPQVELVEELTPQFAQVLRKARERKGMTQKEFARHVNLKESIVHKIETSSYEPSLDLAKKLEKSLGISLVVEREEKASAVKPVAKPSSQGMTIGDFIKVR